MCIGEDRDGITEISLDNLKKIVLQEHKLKRVDIYGKENAIEFVFEAGDFYRASGFSIGYGGTGPHGLWRAIQMFCPGNIDKDFWATGIASLDKNKDWTWQSQTGFVEK
jgi:hypothetical protein